MCSESASFFGQPRVRMNTFLATRSGYMAGAPSQHYAELRIAAQGDARMWRPGGGRPPTGPRGGGGAGRGRAMRRVRLFVVLFVVGMLTVAGTIPAAATSATDSTNPDVTVSVSVSPDTATAGGPVAESAR